MADTTYRVRTVYEADTDGATSKVSALASSFGGVARAFDGAAVGGALAVATVGVGLLLHGVTSLNAGAEEARISIAGLFQAGTGGQGAAGFQEALAESDSIIQRMRVHANELPGEFRDLQNVFEGGLLPGLEAGKTAEQIEGLSATFMAVTQGFHIESQNAGRELQMLLEGRAGGHIAMWNHISGLVGKTAQQFNAMSRAARFEAIEHALAGFGPMVQAYGNTWAAAESTAKDHLSQLLRVGTAPLFEHMKDALNQANHWFEANQASLERWATLIGTRIAHGFDYIVDKGHQLFEMIQHFDLSHMVEQVQHLGGGMVAARAGMSLLGSTSVLEGAGGLVGGGAMAGAGVIGLVLAPIIAAFATGSVDFGATMHDIGQSVGPIITAFGSLASAFVPLLAAVGAPLIEAFTGLLHIVSPLIAGFANLTAAVLRHAGSLLSDIGEGLSNIFQLSDAEKATDAEQQQRDRNLRLNAPMPTLDPSVMMGMVAQSAMGDRLEIDRAFQEWMPQINLNVNQLLDQVSRHDVVGQSESVGFFGQLLREQRAAAAAHPATAHHPATPTAHTTVNVRIEQTINDASDPDRVVTSTRQAVRDAWLHPIESHSVAVIHGG